MVKYPNVQAIKGQLLSINRGYKVERSLNERELLDAGPEAKLVSGQKEDGMEDGMEEKIFSRRGQCLLGKGKKVLSG